MSTPIITFGPSAVPLDILEFHFKGYVFAFKKNGATVVEGMITGMDDDGVTLIISTFNRIDWDGPEMRLNITTDFDEAMYL